MRDPYLAAIIDSVEKGGDPVAISVALHSGAVVSGYVRRSQFFASVTKDEVRRIHDQASFAGKVSDRVTREIKDGMRVQVERIDSVYASRLDDSSDDADTVTLSDVTMLWSSGDGLKLKTIRLSLDAIAAWWVAKGDPIKAPKDGNAFWAVGVTF
jgi:hypothetical protein